LVVARHLINDYAGRERSSRKREKSGILGDVMFELPQVTTENKQRGPLTWAVKGEQTSPHWTKKKVRVQGKGCYKVSKAVGRSGWIRKVSKFEALREVKHNLPKEVGKA